MGIKQNSNEVAGDGSELKGGLGNTTFSKQDVAQRIKNAKANKKEALRHSGTEALRLGLYEAEREWKGYISELEWVLACMEG